MNTREEFMIDIVEDKSEEESCKNLEIGERLDKLSKRIDKLFSNYKHPINEENKQSSIPVDDTKVETEVAKILSKYELFINQEDKQSIELDDDKDSDRQL